MACGQWLCPNGDCGHYEDDGDCKPVVLSHVILPIESAILPPTAILHAANLCAASGESLDNDHKFFDFA